MREELFTGGDFRITEKRVAGQILLVIIFTLKFLELYENLVILFRKFWTVLTQVEDIRMQSQSNEPAAAVRFLV